jgi:hypothetical protein
MHDCDAFFQYVSRAHAGQFRDPSMWLTVYRCAGQKTAVAGDRAEL